ncbi:MAG: hypothetical protein ACYTKD_09700 [Planctomycetota bacterium]
MRALAKTAFLGVLVSGFLGAGCFDEFVELLPDDGWGSNHTFDNAADITAEEANILAGALITSPEDYFVLTTASVGTLFITCTPQVEVNDVEVLLYDSGYNLLDSGTVNVDTLEITYDAGGSGAPVGTYYILVSYIGALGGDSYVLTWSLL